MGRKREVRRLVAIFAALYFVQGSCEPTDGLISQPLRAGMLAHGATPGTVAQFLAIVGLPWAIKPLYGVAVDLVPILGMRRRAWMVLSTSLATIGLAWLAIHPPEMTPGWSPGLLLVLPTFGIALGDVVTDALMIETGQPLGVTGTLQSAQWTASYSATIAIGWIVGWLTDHDQSAIAFGIAAVLSFASLLVALVVIREPPPPVDPPEAASFRGALRSSFSPRVLRAAAFLFLLAFNPFAALEYAHVTIDLGLSETHYGQTVSVFAIFAVIACLSYGWAAERFAVKRLAHVALGSSVLVTLGLMLVVDAASDFALSIGSALAWTFAFLLQADVAARLCPPRYSGTVFALLMAVSNGADSLAAYLGGALHEWLSPRLGASLTYDLLVVSGALGTLGAWALVPRLAADHALAKHEEETGRAEA